MHITFHYLNKLINARSNVINGFKIHSSQMDISRTYNYKMVFIFFFRNPHNEQKR